MTAIFLAACVVPPADVVELPLPPPGCSAVMYVAPPVPTCVVGEGVPVSVLVTARDGRARLRCSAECGALKVRVVPGIANDRVGGYPQRDCPPWSGAPGLQFLTTRP